MGDLSNIDWTETGLIPIGEYRAVVVKAPLTDTKAGTGNYLKMEIQIVSGPHKNGRVFHNLTMNNRNPKAVAMGRKDLTGLCNAIGLKVDELTDTSQILNKPLRIKLGHELNEEYGDRETVKKFMTDVGGTPDTEEAAAPW
jgi:hypothetical protein